MMGREVLEHGPARLMLEKYIEWQNFGNGKYWNTYGVDIVWTIDEFFSDDWEETFVIGNVESGSCRVVVLSAGTGDDGGPATLIGYFSRVFKDEELLSLCQEFDLGFHQIYGQEYGSGKIGFMYEEVKVDEVEAQGLKLGEQKYSEEEAELMKKRPVVHNG